jgi:hypothetical protein
MDRYYAGYSQVYPNWTLNFSRKGTKDNKAQSQSGTFA